MQIITGYREKNAGTLITETVSHINSGCTMNQKNSVMICGFGVSGKAAARLAGYLGKHIVLVDENNSREMRDQAAEIKKQYPCEMELYFSWTPEITLPRCETAVMSLGIRRGTPLFQTAEQSAGKVISELEFAFSHITCPIAAITGTNGKTTTTELTTALLKASAIRAESAGNIGHALSDCAIEVLEQRVKYLVVEVSSFQIDTISKFPECPAAILNIASDHIDRHGGMDAYAATKFRIFASSPEAPQETRIINSSLMDCKNRFLPPELPMTTFSATDPRADFTLENGIIRFRGREILPFAESRLKGVHNAENIMAALALVRALLGEDAIFASCVKEAIRAFQPDAHRMEVFLEKNGVRYINDSKATNPHAVNAAVGTFADGRNIILILGGLDKDMDFTELEKSLPHIRQAFLIGQCKEKIHEAIARKVKCKMSSSLESAVKDACSIAEAGDCVMLSPATASMDMFKNYAERGNRFKEIVTELLVPKEQ